MSFLQVDVINMATLRCCLTVLYKTSEKRGSNFGWKEKYVYEGADWDCRHEHAQLSVPSPIQWLPRQLASKYVRSHVSLFTNRHWVKIFY